MPGSRLTSTLEGSLLDSIDNIKPDRGEQDILYELLLKLGLNLCIPIETRNIVALVHNSDRGRELAWPRLPSSDHLAIRHPERCHGVENLAPDPSHGLANANPSPSYCPVAEITTLREAI